MLRNGMGIVYLISLFFCLFVFSFESWPRFSSIEAHFVVFGPRRIRSIVLKLKRHYYDLTY